MHHLMSEQENALSLLVNDNYYHYYCGFLCHRKVYLMHTQQMRRARFTRKGLVTAMAFAAISPLSHGQSTESEASRRLW